MREIRFRVWDQVSKKMITSEENTILFEIYLDGSYLGLARDAQDWEEERFILMQYTGLKDKNGRDVYESDVVRADVFGTSAYGEVRFIDGAFRILDSRDRAFMPIVGFNQWVEVIGNIFEHSFLLDSSS